MTEQLPTMRSEEPGDREAIRTVNREAFGREDEANLVDAIRQSTNFIPQLSLVAEKDALVVGHIMVSTIVIQGDNCAIPALELAPVAVLPDWQRHGIGGLLVREAISRARDLGHNIMILVGHPTYYPRFGFRPANDYGIKGPHQWSYEAFMVIELRPGALDSAQGVVVQPTYFMITHDV